MNKDEYLKELRKNLKILKQSDRDEAIEFYEEYFDEAGVENEAKVIEELGEPKALAKKILVDVVDRQYAPEEESSNLIPAPVIPTQAEQIPNQQNVQFASGEVSYQQGPQFQQGQQSGQYQPNAQFQPNAQYQANAQYQPNQPQTEQKKSSGFKKLLIVLAAVFALPLSPVLIALIIVALTLVFVAYIVLISLILAAGAFIVSGLASLIAGIFVVFASPFGGMAVMGTGLTMFGVGTLMMIGTVALFRLLTDGLANLLGKLVHRKNKKNNQQNSNYTQVY